MRAVGTGTQAWLLGSALLFSSPVFVSAAEGHQSRGHTVASPSNVHHVSARYTHTYHAGYRHAGYATSRTSGGHGRRYAGHAYGISCVPYAREVSGIMVAGNAREWWWNAAGQYARGNQPEAGSVLNFRANSRMPLGHVAVVSKVINAREIVVDQANWGGRGMRGGVSQNVAVVDVSEANNWSAVRVALGHGGEFGSVYPTYGFIYNRPDNGMVMASINRPAPQPDINPVPSDLRPVAERGWRTIEEVAEAPAGLRR
jgi:surface antigen